MIQWGMRTDAPKDLQSSRSVERRRFAALLVGGLAAAIAGCADRSPEMAGDPVDAPKRCFAGLARMGQLVAKPGGRCG